MSMPPGEPPEPPTSPMTPYPAAEPPSYATPVSPPAYEASHQPPAAPSYSDYPAAASYPDYPAAEPEPGYAPPAPSQPAPSYVAAPPAPPAPPPPYAAAPPPYSSPRQYPGGLASVEGDALVLPPGSSFGAWFSMVTRIAKRSWKSAVIIATLGIGVPRALVDLIGGLSDWGDSYTIGEVGAFFRLLFNGFNLAGLLVLLLACVAGCFVAAAGWSAGVWALVEEAATSRPANLSQAFSYGFRRAAGLFPWTVAAGAVFTVGYALLWLPGVYVAFALSMFGLVALFERSPNPLARSFSLTHNSATIGPTLGKVGLGLLGYSVLAGLAHGIFAAIGAVLTLGVNVAGGVTGIGSAGSTPYDVVTAIGEIFTGPAFAVLLIVLLPTYAELRARENGGASTAQLQQQLG